MPFLFFLLGLIIGSFSNVCIWRLPQHKSIITPRSFCPSCHHLIPWYDNIPLLSFLILRGRCRYCKEKISLRYPLIELISGLCYLIIYLKFKLTFDTLIFIFLFTFLIILSGIDYYHQILPDYLVYPLCGLGLIFSPLNKLLGYSFIYSLIGLIVGFLLLFLIAKLGNALFKKETMGGGDIKLFAAIGAFTGAINVFWILILACLIGVIVNIFFKNKSRYSQISFAPYISLATFVIILSQPYLNQWYLKI